MSLRGSEESTAAGDMEWLFRIRGGLRLRGSLIRAGMLGRGRPRAYWYRGLSNFGDQLASVMIEAMWGARPVWVSRDFEGKLLAVGSILHNLRRNDVVWGAGLIEDDVPEIPSGVTFLAVRGPLTAERIDAEVPAVYGDPALLLPLVYDAPVPVEADVGVVPHYVDFERVTADTPHLRVIDVRRPWRHVVDSIRSCRHIVSSSLHGLVAAEAYGIQASWVRISPHVRGGDFKFHDYLLGSGREISEPTPWEAGIDEALAASLPPLHRTADELIQVVRDHRSS